MGYYSDVTLALTKAGVKALKESLFANSIPGHVKKEVCDLLKYASKHSIDKQTGAEIWSWDSIKWYTCDPENFPEVDFLEKFLNVTEEKEYRFMRIGENYDDVEVNGYFIDNPFEMSLSRQIRMNC